MLFFVFEDFHETSSKCFFRQTLFQCKNIRIDCTEQCRMQIIKSLLCFLQKKEQQITLLPQEHKAHVQQYTRPSTAVLALFTSTNEDLHLL